MGMFERLIDIGYDYTRNGLMYNHFMMDIVLLFLWLIG